MVSVFLTRNYLKSTLKTTFASILPAVPPKNRQTGFQSNAVQWDDPLQRVPDPHSPLKGARVVDLWLTQLCSSHQPFLVGLARRVPWLTVGT